MQLSCCRTLSFSSCCLLIQMCYVQIAVVDLQHMVQLQLQLLGEEVMLWFQLITQLLFLLCFVLHALLCFSHIVQCFDSSFPGFSVRWLFVAFIFFIRFFPACSSFATGQHCVAPLHCTSWSVPSVSFHLPALLYSIWSSQHHLYINATCPHYLSLPFLMTILTGSSITSFRAFFQCCISVKVRRQCR